jgi:hypothetical protein
MKKLLIIVAVLIVGVFVYNFDAVLGQRKFERLCKEEGGSRIYAKVEKDAGWYVEQSDLVGYEDAFNFGPVKFVRFRDKFGDTFDVYHAPGPNQWTKGYRRAPVDPAESVRYQLTIEQAHVPNDQRMSRTQFVIKEIESGNVVATNTRFSYEWANPDRMIFSFPTSQSCDGNENYLSFTRSIFHRNTEK